MEINDYTESRCCFDASAYKKAADAAPTAEKLSVPEIIKGLDALYEQGRENEAQSYLEGWLRLSREKGDWRSELSMLSELLGQYRRSGDSAKGLECVRQALELIEAHSMADTLSGATVLLNAATTLKCFGRAKEATGLFTRVSRVYSERLDPLDYRFAGLYNNMALALADEGEYKSAEQYFLRAMAVMEHCPGGENELAVSCCNLAELYGRQDMEDERIGQRLEMAWDYLNSDGLKRDGYHAFTISKCAPCFDYFGYFLYAAELRERAKRIYEGT